MYVFVFEQKASDEVCLDCAEMKKVVNDVGVSHLEKIDNTTIGRK